ncbi:MAG: MFS transporter [Microbacteriaceae bacterium]|nr:MFS transporter [Microbacteriaceae bacterium]HPZ34421.1 MFS transporter [Microbacteriaceae bacterium]HQC92357.1 MFS transporter [Microbacteriaceae bacterium]
MTDESARDALVEGARDEPMRADGALTGASPSAASTVEAAAETSAAVESADELPDPPHWLRSVILFMSGQMVSMLGSMIVQFAVMWYMTIVYQSGLIIAVVAVVGFLPQAIISIFGGVWADRHNRKRLVIGADAAIALSTLALALIILSGFDAVWLIFLTLAVRSAGTGVQMPAASSMVPQITPRRHLMRVNGLMQSVNASMALLAPALAGAVFGLAAAAAADGSGAPPPASVLVPIFMIDVVTAVFGIGLLAMIRVPTLARAEGEADAGYFADLIGGVRYIAGHGFVRWLLFVYAGLFILIVAPANLTPLMLVRSFGGTESEDVLHLAVLEVAYSAGLVLGGIVIAMWGGLRNRLLLIVLAAFGFGTLSIGLGLSPSLLVFFACMAVLGVVSPFFGTSAMTLLQETVEPSRQGRVFGFVGIVTALAMPFGMAVFGPLADVISVELLLVSAGLLTFVVMGLALVLPAGRRAMAAAREVSAPRRLGAG